MMKMAQRIGTRIQHQNPTITIPIIIIPADTVITPISVLSIILLHRIGAMIPGTTTATIIVRGIIRLGTTAARSWDILSWIIHTIPTRTIIRIITSTTVVTAPTAVMAAMPVQVDTAAAA